MIKKTLPVVTVLTILVLLNVLLSLVACSIKEDEKKLDIGELCTNIQYVYNIRYTGYQSNTDNEIITNTFDEELANKIIDRFQRSKEEDFLSLTDDYNEAIRTNKTIDKNIVKQGENYGVLLSSLKYVNGKAVVILGDNIIEISADTNSTLQALRNNPKYYFEIEDYNLYENGELIIKFSTNTKLRMTLEEYLELYPYKDKWEYKMDIEMQAETIERRYSFTIGENGKVKYVTNINNIVGTID